MNSSPVVGLNEWKHLFLAMLDKMSTVDTKGGGRTIKNCDIVVSLVCVEWPFEAVEFETRKRMSSPSWPPARLIKDIVNAGCHLVKVMLCFGNQSSSMNTFIRH